MSKKGFTLLELLIVIAILALLAAAAVVVLNPAELLRRARDTRRITDMANTRNAVNLYLTTVASTTLDAGSASPNYRCIGSSGTRSIFTTVALGATATGSAAINSSATLQVTSAVRTVDGSGWIPLPFNQTAGGSPLSAIPIDSVNSATGCSQTQGCAYYYMCNFGANGSSTYEIGTNMESNSYANTGDNDVESPDGGNTPSWYEVGTQSGLNL